ncbi:MAG: IS1182 family transposase [Deltaproteobacteria bacterium]|nr:IS1182 family transposase [Deltaproteobacteria bacterium]
MKTQIFKPYEQNQMMLLPPSLEEMIPEGHLVRMVNAMIDGIDKRILEAQYKGGGTSAYDPVMLLKVIIYAYSQRIFSSRQIAKELRENVNYMWLSGMNRPDHRTINRFRGTVMKAVVDEVFYGIVEQLLDEGYVDLESYFMDGTKMEANANRYTYVWRKSIENYKAKLREKVEELLKKIDEVEAAEERQYGEGDLPEVGEGKEIDAEKLKEAADKINERLKQKPDDKALKQAQKALERDYIPRLEKYETYEKKFEERNSFSKTDEDATFMRMKEDHMHNGQLKAGYNIQLGTQNQFILGYSIHRRAGDIRCLKDHLERLRAWLGEYPETLVADAGYGSEENYCYLEDKGIEPFVKYSSFHYEQKRNYKKKKPYRSENFTYHADEDEYECPQGERLQYVKTKRSKNKDGFQSERRIYECGDCSGCPVKEACTQAVGNRQIQIGVELERLKRKARENLLSPRGKILRSKRPIEVEAVFGRLKQDWGFRRFSLRGLEKVTTEWGLLCIAHNIAKAAVQ